MDGRGKWAKFPRWKCSPQPPRDKDFDHGKCDLHCRRLPPTLKLPGLRNPPRACSRPAQIASPTMPSHMVTASVKRPPESVQKPAPRSNKVVHLGLTDAFSPPQSGQQFRRRLVVCSREAGHEIAGASQVKRVVVLAAPIRLHEVVDVCQVSVLVRCQVRPYKGTERWGGGGHATIGGR